MKTQPLDCDWIAVEWKADVLRTWAMSRDGQVLKHNSADATCAGPDVERALSDLVGAWRRPDRAVPTLIAGAPGAPLRPVPCAPLPEVLPDGSPGNLPPGVQLIPGLSRQSPADLTRGEEVVIAGFLAKQPQFDGVLCLPGRISRWVRVSAGEVVGFSSYLTGATIAALSDSPELRDVVAGRRPGMANDDQAAFENAVTEALAAPARVTARLASLHGEARMGALAPATARARLSGLLIGQEIAGAKSWWLGMAVAVLGEEPMASHYARALALQGAVAGTFDAEPLLLAGFRRARDAYGFRP